MVFIVPIGLILMLLLCAIATGYAILQNIGIIIVALIIIVVLIFLFFRYPVFTIVTAVLFSIVSLCYIGISNHLNEQEEANNAVAIYIATDQCIFYDEEENIVKIPKGAIIAIYIDPDQISVEKNTNLHSKICTWYIDGKLQQATVSYRHNTKMKKDGSNAFGVENNTWNIQTIKHMSIADFKSQEWWILDN